MKLLPSYALVRFSVDRGSRTSEKNPFFFFYHMNIFIHTIGVSIFGFNPTPESGYIFFRQHFSDLYAHIFWFCGNSNQAVSTS